MQVHIKVVTYEIRWVRWSKKQKAFSVLGQNSDGKQMTFSGMLVLFSRSSKHFDSQIIGWKVKFNVYYS